MYLRSPRTLPRGEIVPSRARLLPARLLCRAGKGSLRVGMSNLFQGGSGRIRMEHQATSGARRVNIALGPRKSQFRQVRHEVAANTVSGNYKAKFVPPAGGGLVLGCRPSSYE